MKTIDQLIEEIKQHPEYVASDIWVRSDVIDMIRNEIEDDYGDKTDQQKDNIAEQLYEKNKERIERNIRTMFRNIPCDYTPTSDIDYKL